jgi:hypothetical protein
MMMLDEPWPQPMSATLAPRSSFSWTPSSAGIQESTRLAAYIGRKNRSVPQNRQGPRLGPVVAWLEGLGDISVHTRTLVLQKRGTNQRPGPDGEVDWSGIFETGEIVAGVEVGSFWNREKGDFDHAHLTLWYADEASTAA